jgi:UDP-N-acetyl-D-mannosaminuronate dehydrogenase
VPIDNGQDKGGSDISTRLELRPGHAASEEEAARVGMRVAVIGNGYVGTVTTSCLTWLGHRVTGLEMKAQLAEQLSAGQVHFHEPGLSSLLSEALATGRLDFSADPDIAL